MSKRQQADVTVKVLKSDLFIGFIHRNNNVFFIDVLNNMACKIFSIRLYYFFLINFKIWPDSYTFFQFLSLKRQRFSLNVPFEHYWNRIFIYGIISILLFRRHSIHLLPMHSENKFLLFEVELKAFGIKCSLCVCVYIKLKKKSCVLTFSNLSSHNKSTCNATCVFKLCFICNVN